MSWECRDQSPLELVTFVSLYVDDMAIFCHPDEAELRTILALLGDAYTHQLCLVLGASVPSVACSDEEALEAAEVMECQLASFPVKYLRIPLTVGRLLASMLQPLVDIISFRLPLWKVGMMTKAGHLALVKSVLMPIALHQTVVLGINKKALKKIKRIVRSFIWTGRENANGGHCHVNWVRVCRPLSMGGLRILDLACTTINLRMH
jgi:hypothetical protein